MWEIMVENITYWSCKFVEESGTGCLVHCPFYSALELLKILGLALQLHHASST